MDYEIVIAVTRQGEEVRLRRYSDTIQFSGHTTSTALKHYSYTFEDGTPVKQFNGGELHAPGFGFMKVRDAD